MHDLPPQKDPELIVQPWETKLEFSFDRLILLGMIMCDGTFQERAEVFWNACQDHDSLENLAYTDKDLFPAF